MIRAGPFRTYVAHSDAKSPGADAIFRCTCRTNDRPVGEKLSPVSAECSEGVSASAVPWRRQRSHYRIVIVTTADQSLKTVLRLRTLTNNSSQNAFLWHAISPRRHPQPASLLPPLRPRIWPGNAGCSFPAIRCSGHCDSRFVSPLPSDQAAAR